MNITPGTRLGPYEITAAIGAGGMGEVYRARDTRLDRSVAIKVLPDRLSSNPQLRERFAREAKAISGLSHPHICALFDIGQENGADYLVMELLEGETLADRLAKGPLPPEQVIRYGVQIAEALHAAHRQGIVHRDLKPGNVMLTKSGAKLLDFGLATVGVAAHGHPAAETAAATLQMTERRALTEEGVVLGTFQYMAPEQVEGLPADARTDIFALGVTLYEMATGRRAFEGKTRASLIASILDREPPPVSSVVPATPLALDRVIRACLAKDRDERWQSAHDVATELRWIADTSSEMLADRGRRGMSKRLLWGAGGAIAGIALGAAGAWIATRDATPPAPVARFTIPLPPQAPLFFGGTCAVAVSPDGARLVYRGLVDQEERLYTRMIGQFAPVFVAGTEGAEIPAFSPDGRSLAFMAQQKLKRVSLDGGLPVVLTTTPGGSLGISWRGDTIYFVRGFTGGIWSVPAAGGTPKQLIKVDPQRGVRAIVWPDVLPGEKHVLATVWNAGTWDEAKIVAYPLEGRGEPKTIVDGGTFGRYVSPGHLLYVRGGTLYGIRFDLEELRTIGAPAPLLAGVASGALNGEAHYAVSQNGTLLYAAGGVIEDKRSLLWVDRGGKETPVVPTQRPYNGPVLSPDGRTIALTLETATFDVWQLDIERDSLSRVSFGGDDSSPTWTPDGNRILFSSSRTGHNNVWMAAADNSGSEQRLSTADRNEFINGVSSDGRFAFVTQENSGESQLDLALLSLDGSRKTQPFLNSRFNETSGHFSPDGKWCLYNSDESGAEETYLRPFPGPGGKWQVSIGGADGAVFAKNGREIIYRKGMKFFTVPVELAPRVRVGKPQLLFEKVHYDGAWDVSPDGQRILLIRNDAQRTAAQMHIVMNWFEDLKRRLPSP